jgi:hypothetical protein
MDRAARDQLREALLTVTALKTSMEHALRSDPKACWPHWAYRDYMRKYNKVVEYVQTLMPITLDVRPAAASECEPAVRSNVKLDGLKPVLSGKSPEGLAES